MLRFSPLAEADLVGIGRYTLQTWGPEQAERYLGDLERFCQKLADNPSMGRRCDEVRPGLQRLEHGQHVAFYRQMGDGVLVSRVLHRSMLPEEHFAEEQDD